MYLFNEDGIRIGGLDYSENLIRIMREVFDDEILVECLCNEADQLPVEVKYDAVFSNSVFSYFPDFDYAEHVLERMLEKANSCIGLLDIHDKRTKEEFLAYRKATVENYEERYQNLPKLFYSKEFFSDFAVKHKLQIKFPAFQMPGYWNNEFVFHCFMYRAR